LGKKKDKVVSDLYSST